MLEVKSFDAYFSSNDREVSVGWRVNDLQIGKAKIKKGDFKRYRAEIRSALGTLNSYVTFNRDWEEELDPGFERYNKILRTLRRQGSVMFDLITHDLPRLTDLLFASAINTPINVIIDDEEVAIPLGFVCNKSDHCCPTIKPSAEDFIDFWTSRFSITNWTSAYTSSFDSSAITSSNFRALYAVDKQEWKDSSEELFTKMPDCSKIYDVPFGKKHCWEDITSSWEEMKSFDGIVCFFAHSNGEAIDLSGEKIHGVEIEKIFHGKNANTRVALFVNACLSLAGSQDSETSVTSILSLMTGQRFAGLIGTEAEIQNAAALLCGSRFVADFCFNEMSLGDAFDKMRQDPKLFPLNLFYSFYGERDFRLDHALAKPN